MPHVIVKIWPGKSEDQKKRLADAITKSITDILEYGEHSVSVAIQEVPPSLWAARVYKVEIELNVDRLYKKPGYDLRDLESVTDADE